METMDDIRKSYAFRVEYRKVDPQSLLTVEQSFHYITLEGIWDYLYDMRFDWRRDDEDYRIYLEELDDTTQCKVVNSIQLK